MHSDYDSAIHTSFQSGTATPMNLEYSLLPGETIRVPKQEEDDYCTDGPTGSQTNPICDVVSSL